MIKAIIYTSKTGHTKQYAELLGQMTGCKVYEQGKTAGLEKGAEVIHMGWIMGGMVKGLAKTMKSYSVKMVCAVGMERGGTQDANVRQVNGLEKDIALFTVQGGVNFSKLKGFSKIIMNFVRRTAIKKLTAKKTLTDAENEMLNLMQKGGSMVSAEKLTATAEWVNNYNKGVTAN